ncbi:hypothetical protein BGX31_004038, partial [Mortierella sp. GBA43]
ETPKTEQDHKEREHFRRTHLDVSVRVTVRLPGGLNSAIDFRRDPKSNMNYVCVCKKLLLNYQSIPSHLESTCKVVRRVRANMKQDNPYTRILVLDEPIPDDAIVIPVEIPERRNDLTIFRAIDKDVEEIDEIEDLHDEKPRCVAVEVIDLDKYEQGSLTRQESTSSQDEQGSLTRQGSKSSQTLRRLLESVVQQTKEGMDDLKTYRETFRKHDQSLDGHELTLQVFNNRLKRMEQKAE